MQNDSLSLVDTDTRKVLREVHFFTPGQTQAIGELPYWVAIRSGADQKFARAYVTSQRDGQVLSVAPGGTFKIITVGGEPNRAVLSPDQSRLYVANGDKDEIDEIDTTTDTLRRRISLLRPGYSYIGAGPDGLAQSPDGTTLYVTLSNENAVAVVDLPSGTVRGRIPTGWFPSDVVPSRDGSRLYVINTKNISGPSDHLIKRRDGEHQIPPDGHNGYVLALEKAGLLSFPTPDQPTLTRLSATVDQNNNFAGNQPDPMMAFLHAHIHHVIYVMKENRTYDQVLGDLPQGNGDPARTQFPRPITPNNHALAERFALLDNFDTAGDVSGDGWNWTFQGHANVYTNRTVGVAYGNADYHIPFDWNGLPRNIGVALPDRARHPSPATVRITTLLDPTGHSAIEPGPKDITADEGADDDSPDALGGYLWDAALRAGKSLRHYGVYADENYYILKSPVYLPIVRNAAQIGALQSVPVRPALLDHNDPYYRGWDLKHAGPVPVRGMAARIQPVRGREEYARPGNRAVHDGPFRRIRHQRRRPRHPPIADGQQRLRHRPTRGSRLTLAVLAGHRDFHRRGRRAGRPRPRRQPPQRRARDFPLHARKYRDPHTLRHHQRAAHDRAYSRHRPPRPERRQRPPDERRIHNYPRFAPLRRNRSGLLCQKPVSTDLVPECRHAGRVVTRTTVSSHDGAWWTRGTAGMDFSRPDRIDSARFNALLAAGLAPRP
ncbi:MAG: YncE family protein [Rhodospirillales bacterium]